MRIKYAKHIILLFELKTSIEAIEKHLELMVEYNFHSVIVICEFMDKYYTDEFGEIIMAIPIHKKLIVLNSPWEKNFESTMFFTSKNKPFGYDKSRGEFKVSFNLFDESQNYHTYFNRKFFIDKKGEIKNAPECQNDFGNIKDLSSEKELESIISTKLFQKYWFVKKDETIVCKDCEFRYLCVDNRLPVINSNSEWYHKEECNYNPYIGKWKGESEYRTLGKCGVISNEKGFNINEGKLENCFSEE